MQIKTKTKIYIIHHFGHINVNDSDGMEWNKNKVDFNGYIFIINLRL